jgi:hypothetical protein
MAKRKNNSDWWLGVLFVAVGVGILYYVQTGLGRENDSALLPNKLEGQIDLLVTRLNQAFGTKWVTFGLDVLTHFVRANLSAPLVDLVGVVVAVENESKRRSMTSKQKQHMAVRLARR